MVHVFLKCGIVIEKMLLLLLAANWKTSARRQLSKISILNAAGIEQQQQQQRALLGPVVDYYPFLPCFLDERGAGGCGRRTGAGWAGRDPLPLFLCLLSAVSMSSSSSSTAAAPWRWAAESAIDVLATTAASAPGAGRADVKEEEEANITTNTERHNYKNNNMEDRGVITYFEISWFN